jgi:hypothetical protein
MKKNLLGFSRGASIGSTVPSYDEPFGCHRTLGFQVHHGNHRGLKKIENMHGIKSTLKM